MKAIAYLSYTIQNEVPVAQVESSQFLWFGGGVVCFFAIGSCELRGVCVEG